MNKILFLSLVLFVAETVSAEEGLQPYLFFGNCGQTIQMVSFNHHFKHLFSSQGQSHHLLLATPTNSAQSDTLSQQYL